jgi:hypothetical protein
MEVPISRFHVFAEGFISAAGKYAVQPVWLPMPLLIERNTRIAARVAAGHGLSGINALTFPLSLNYSRVPDEAVID